MADTIVLPCACQGSDQINIKDITTPPFDITGGYQLEYTHGENPKKLPTVNLTRSGARSQECHRCCPAVQMGIKYSIQSFAPAQVQI